MATILPSPREVITAIISSATPDARPALLTLHALFPTTLLPALDLLDRGLVTKLTTRTGSSFDPETDSNGKENGTSQALPNTSDHRSADSRTTRQQHALLRPQDSPPLPLSQFSTAHAILLASAQQQQQQNAVPTNISHASAAKHATSVAETSAAAPAGQTVASSLSVSGDDMEIYIVRSAQTPSSHHHHHHHHNDRSSSSTFSAPAAPGLGSTYEVRLQAWNCSCAAFTFAAFPASITATAGFSSPKVVAKGAGEFQNLASSGVGSFGGLGVDMPVCKHLLACVLAERGGNPDGDSSFANFVGEGIVSAEEIAGWAAGWGD